MFNIPLSSHSTTPSQPTSNTALSRSTFPAPPLLSNTTSSATFDIRKLYNREKNRDDHRQELYDSIVRKIHHRVETVTMRKETHCLFQVPQFILGMPLYDPFQCTGYVIQTLTAQGFHVKYYHPNTLFVDWSRHHIEPYVQALDRREASKESVLGTNRNVSNISNHYKNNGARAETNEISPLNLDYVPTGKLFGGIE